MKKMYITTPIYYPSARPHLGHLYSTLLADVIARWYRLQNKKVFFTTGTDEHGQKIAQAAGAHNQSPQQFLDTIVPVYKDLWKQYEISNDLFVRTTNPAHIEGVVAWINLLKKNGDIYKDFYRGWYCVPCEMFVADIQDSPEPVTCTSCGRNTEQISEESYFFKLSSYQEKLLDWYAKNPHWIVPHERAAEVVSFVSAGLRDLSISRSSTAVTWGIPFPGDSAQMVYVWADALNSYITAAGYGSSPVDQFTQLWPADIQILGKDILRFHAVYWPAFLMAAGLELPKKLLVHGWITVNNQKMSKSLGNSIYPQDLLTNFHPDTVRYYLIKQCAITHDGSVSIPDLERHIETDLANNLGNLLNRISTIAVTNNFGTLSSSCDTTVYEQGIQLLREYQKYMELGTLHMALTRVWKYIQELNGYVHAHEPWKLVKTDLGQAREVIYSAAHGLALVGVVLSPFMPEKMEVLLKSMGISGSLNTVFTEWDIKPGAYTFTRIPPLFIKPEHK